MCDCHCTTFAGTRVKVQDINNDEPGSNAGPIKKVQKEESKNKVCKDVKTDV